VWQFKRINLYIPVLKSSWAISRVNVELKINVVEISPVSITRIEPVFMKLSTYITAPEIISTA
jgi:hypothetical protein